MHHQGWQVTGIDRSAAAVEHVCSTLKMPALVGTLPHPKLRPGSFDVITMRQSLEHVHNPLEILQHARRLLVHGGKLFVVVPNIDSLPFRLFGNVWYGLNLPRHLTHFAPWTLQLMMQRAGYRVGPVRMIARSSGLLRSASRACASPIHSRWHRLLTHRPVAWFLASCSYVSQQSDCIMVTAER